jgi:putative ABC transport system substrate-binding protein
MKRREFIAGFGAAATWPFSARAQQAGMHVIGFLNSASPELFADRVRAFREGLIAVGLIEGRSVSIEYRWANDKFDRLQEFADDLVRRRVNVIATGSNLPAARAANDRGAISRASRLALRSWSPSMSKSRMNCSRWRRSSLCLSIRRV